MNNTEEQDEVLNGLDFKRIHVLLKPEHIDFLKKLDENNISNSIRILIDKYMKMTKRQSIERYLLWVVFGISIILLISLILPII